MKNIDTLVEDMYKTITDRTQPSEKDIELFDTLKKSLDYIIGKKNIKCYKLSTEEGEPHEIQHSIY